MTGRSFHIRDGRAADAPALAKLRLAFRTELGVATENGEAFVARCTEWMTRRLGEPSPWRCWLAETGEGPLASLWLQQIEKIPNPVGEPELHAYLTNFYVVPTARGLGLGDRMLALAVDWCRAMRIDVVLLWPSPRSRPLYGRHGFMMRDDLLQLRLALPAD